MSGPDEQLRIVLLALLPKDGTPMTTTELAKLAGTTRSQVAGALAESYLNHAVDFDVRTDAFIACKRGDAL